MKPTTPYTIRLETVNLSKALKLKEPKELRKEIAKKVNKILNNYTK